MSMLQQCALISLPALVGYAVAGPWLVPALFGPQWQDAGRVAPMLLPLALPFTISQFVFALLAARGKITWQRHLAIIDLVTTILVTIATVSYGLRVLALVYSIRTVLLIPLQLHLVGRISSIRASDHVVALRAPLAASLLMGTVAAVLFGVFNPANLLTLGLLCLVAAAVYAAAIAILLPHQRRVVQQLATSYGLRLGFGRT